MKKLPVLLLPLLVLLSVPVMADGEMLIPFELEDHAKTGYSNANWTDRNILIFVADREGNQYNKDHVWSTALVNFAKEADAVAVSVAELKGVPRLTRSFVRKLFAPDASDPVGLTLLDWEGAFSEAYQLEAKAWHLLVFDRNHTLVSREVMHEFDARQLADVLGRLKEVLNNQ